MTRTLNFDELIGPDVEPAEREAEDRADIPLVQELEGLPVAVGDAHEEVGVAFPVDETLLPRLVGRLRR